MKPKPFDNENRNRYYGKRIGDIVTCKAFGTVIENCEVIEYGFMDNNKIYVRDPKGNEFDWVAEWCKVTTKVEDRDDSSNG